MALVKPDEMAAQMRGLGRLSMLRQLGLMLGLAASVALGVGVVMWSRAPNYQLLYSNLSDKDTVAITDALQKVGVPYTLANGTGAVLVPGEKVHEARLQLASQGLPKGSAVGFEMLNEQPTFGTSQFMEAARYQKALEGELERTIGALGNVQGARVHLALPKPSVFVRAAHDQPTASILVTLFPGRSLEEGQVSAVVHLVAASVPNLSVERVTVIDQKGRLLTTPDGARSVQMSSTQFDYRKRVEESYIKRIENIIGPIVGAAALRAQVVADLDFTVTEQTHENFNPDLPSVRSEQTAEDQSVGSAAGASGVPGALTNQPPAAGATGRAPTAAAAGPTPPPSNNSKRVVRNYELDRTVSHTQLASGLVRHLSVAVLLDDQVTLNENQEQVRTPRTPEELSRITVLVKEAVGFDAQRGDTLNVVNASFTVPPPEEAAPELPLLKQPWVWDVAKQVAGGLGVLLLVFGVLRPVLRSLAEKGVAAPLQSQATFPGANGPDDQLTLTHPMRQQLPAGGDYDAQLGQARTLVGQDPKRVAQVVKTWVASDG